MADCRESLQASTNASDNLQSLVIVDHRWDIGLSGALGASYLVLYWRLDVRVLVRIHGYCFSFVMVAMRGCR